VEEFILRALIGGVGIAIVCGPLGCLVVWQRMTYFGAALAHSALLGIALGLLFEINLQVSILGICVAVSITLLAMEKNSQVTSDSALGIIAHGSLAIGILVLTLIPSIRLDLMSYLFGDILSIRWADIYWIAVAGSGTLLVLANIWKPLLSLIIHRDLALVDGVKESRVRLTFLILLSIVIAISMQIVGILLVVSLLIIPAASASRWAASPEQMAGYAILSGVAAVGSGIFISFFWDTPAGPSIVAAASLIYLLSVVLTRR
jgi:zinc transport system permease protein